MRSAFLWPALVLFVVAALLCAGCARQQTAEQSQASTPEQPEQTAVTEAQQTEAPTAAGVEVGWLTDFDAALAKAGQENKPLMVDFYSDWCGWCGKLDEDTYSDPDVQSKAEQFVCVKVNGDAREDLLYRYNIDAYPTVLFLDEEGHEIHRVVGYRGPQEFLGEMDAALANFK